MRRLKSGGAGRGTRRGGMRLALAPACLAVWLSAHSAQAQPLTPLESEVEAILSGPWVMAAGTVNEPLYEAALTAALGRCGLSMFSLGDAQIESLFPSMDYARGDLSIFRFDDAMMIFLAGAVMPSPRKVRAAQLRLDSGHLVRFANDSFWDWERRSWVEVTFAATEWGDIVVGELTGAGRRYTTLLMMRSNGDSGIYVKCAP